MVRRADKPRSRMHLARALFLACFLWPVGCLADASAPHMGANTFDLLLQFSGRSSGGNGSAANRRIGQAMGIKAIFDARAAGFTFLRVMAAGYGPSSPTALWQNDLALWQSDPSAYWANVDAMFDALDQAGLRIVPTFVWNAVQFPVLAGETVTTFISDPTSKSRAVAKRYITEFISRYRARQTILFYEMGNEMNFLADLDLVQRCVRQNGNASPTCRPVGNYSTAALLTFSREMVSLIKQLDPSRGVSSGFGSPRPPEAHLAAKPEYALGGPDWTLDSPSESAKMMLEVNAPFDIVSLHLYADWGNLPPAPAAKKATDVAETVAKLFHPLGKKVFAGEFGGDSNSSVFGDVADLVVRGTVDYAAVWVWDYYPSNTAQAFDPNGHDFRLEPGHGAQALSSLRPALGPPATQPAAPRVILTSPLPCSSVDKPTELIAVASLGAAAPTRVEFLVDGKSVGTATRAPFHMRFDPGGLGQRTFPVEARAYGPDDSVARFTSEVRFNGSTETCSITK